MLTTPAAPNTADWWLLRLGSALDADTPRLEAL